MPRRFVREHGGLLSVAGAAISCLLWGAFALRQQQVQTTALIASIERENLRRHAISEADRRVLHDQNERSIEDRAQLNRNVAANSQLIAQLIETVKQVGGDHSHILENQEAMALALDDIKALLREKEGKP